MKNELVPNEKQVVTGINKALLKMDAATKGYVHSVIEIGERLIEAKKIPRKISFQDWIEAQKFPSEGNNFRKIGYSQAQKYIRVAENKLLVLEYFNSENSVNGLDKAIAEVSPEQLARVKQIEADQLAAEEQAKADRAAKAAELEAKKAQQKEPEIIEGEFTEVKPETKKPEPVEVKQGFVQVDAEHFEELQDRYSETMSVNEHLAKEIDSIVKVFESNDQLTEAAKEIKRLTDINVALENRLNGHLGSYQNERKQMISTINHWKKRAEKAEAKLLEVSNG